MTEAEKILWERLKDRNVFKARFRRQHPIGIFIVDFYFHEYKLAVEIDGEIHLKMRSLSMMMEEVMTLKKLELKY